MRLAVKLRIGGRDDTRALVSAVPMEDIIIILSSASSNSLREDCRQQDSVYPRHDKSWF